MVEQLQLFVRWAGIAGITVIKDWRGPRLRQTSDLDLERGWILVGHYTGRPARFDLKFYAHFLRLEWWVDVANDHVHFHINAVSVLRSVRWIQDSCELAVTFDFN